MFVMRAVLDRKRYFLVDRDTGETYSIEPDKTDGAVAHFETAGSCDETLMRAIEASAKRRRTP